MHKIKENYWEDLQIQLFKDIDKHAEKWIKNNSCGCYNNYDSNYFCCEHLNKDRKRLFKKRIKEQFQYVVNNEKLIKKIGEK